MTKLSLAVVAAFWLGIAIGLWYGPYFEFRLQHAARKLDASGPCVEVPE